MAAAPSWNRLRYFAVDAWDEWRHSPGVNLLATATLGSVLFLTGLGLVVHHNVETWLEQERRDIRVEVYLNDDIDDATRRSLSDALAATRGVDRVSYVDKDQALERFKEFASSSAGLIDDLGTNPLPASIEVFLTPGPGARVTAERIVQETGDRPGVDTVRFDHDLMVRLQALLDLARAGGAGVGLVALTAVVFIMASVLRLAVHARRDEIEIMLLVGATPGFVRGPFLVAGLAQGAVGGLVALVAIELVRRLALARTTGAGAVLDLVAYRPLPSQTSLLLIAIGIVVSLTGSYFAVRRPFRT